MNYLVILLVLVPWAHGQTTNFTSILCHQCSSLADGVNCSEPNETTLTNCTNLGISDVLVSCYSAYRNYDNVSSVGIGWDPLVTDTRNVSEETGIYRGCAIRQANYTDYCAFHAEQYGGINISVVSCQQCEEDGCNSHRFDSYGQIISTSGGMAVHGIVTVTMGAFVLSQLL